MRTSLPEINATAARAAQNPRNWSEIQDRAGRDASNGQLGAAEAIDQTFLELISVPQGSLRSALPSLRMT